MSKATVLILFTLWTSLNSYSQNIDWSNVKSYVAWFNVYESPGLLNLAWNGKPALNSNGPASLYSKTKFPSGSFRATVVDSRTDKEILSDTLVVRDEGSHFLVTYGPSGQCSYAFFHESEFLTAENSKELFFINALGGEAATISYQGLNGEITTKKIDKTLKVQLAEDEQVKAITIQLHAKDGAHRLEQIKLPPFQQLRGLIIVAYLDPDNFSAIRLATFDPSTLELLSGDDPTATPE